MSTIYTTTPNFPASEGRSGETFYNATTSWFMSNQQPAPGFRALSPFNVESVDGTINTRLTAGQQGGSAVSEIQLISSGTQIGEFNISDTDGANVEFAGNLIQKWVAGAAGDDPNTTIYGRTQIQKGVNTALVIDQDVLPFLGTTTTMKIQTGAGNNISMRPNITLIQESTLFNPSGITIRDGTTVATRTAVLGSDIITLAHNNRPILNIGTDAIPYEGGFITQPQSGTRNLTIGYSNTVIHESTIFTPNKLTGPLLITDVSTINASTITNKLSLLPNIQSQANSTIINYANFPTAATFDTLIASTINTSVLTVSTLNGAAIPTPIVGGFLPSGSLIPWAPGTYSRNLTPPDGYLFCDGRLYNITDYPTLGGLLLNTYGGDGTITFATPDMRGGAVAYGGINQNTGLYRPVGVTDTFNPAVNIYGNFTSGTQTINVCYNPFVAGAANGGIDGTGPLFSNIGAQSIVLKGYGAINSITNPPIVRGMKFYPFSGGAWPSGAPYYTLGNIWGLTFDGQSGQNGEAVLLMDRNIDVADMATWQAGGLTVLIQEDTAHQFIAGRTNGDTQAPFRPITDYEAPMTQSQVFRGGVRAAPGSTDFYGQNTNFQGRSGPYSGVTWIDPRNGANTNHGTQAMNKTPYGWAMMYIIKT